MKNANFEIQGALGGDMLLTDPCANLHQSEDLIVGMSRGQAQGLSRPHDEWRIAEPAKAASSTVEPEALAHFLTTTKAKERTEIQEAFSPVFEHNKDIQGPTPGALRGPN